jgi:hypothetical protein
LTVPLIRSDIVFASFGKLELLGVCFVPSEGKTKQPTDQTVSCWYLYFQHELTVILLHLG